MNRPEGGSGDRRFIGRATGEAVLVDSTRSKAEQVVFPPDARRDRDYRICLLSDFEARPGGANIAFCVANGITEDRIYCARADNYFSYFSRDPNPSRRAPYIRRTMGKAKKTD